VLKCSASRLSNSGGMMMNRRIINLQLKKYLL
jgi:hypothetical protein